MNSEITKKQESDSVNTKKTFVLLLTICIILFIICAYFFFKNAQLEDKIQMLERIMK